MSTDATRWAQKTWTTGPMMPVNTTGARANPDRGKNRWYTLVDILYLDDDASVEIRADEGTVTMTVREFKTKLGLI